MSYAAGVGVGMGVGSAAGAGYCSCGSSSIIINKSLLRYNSKIEDGDEQWEETDFKERSGLKCDIRAWERLLIIATFISMTKISVEGGGLE
jgi:hypothetical protein